jgi:hypothetical protein
MDFDTIILATIDINIATQNVFHFPVFIDR